MIRRRRGDGIFLTGMAQTSQGMRPTRVLLEGEVITRLPDMHRVIESPVRRTARNSIIDRVEAEIRRIIAGGPIKGGMP